MEETHLPVWMTGSIALLFFSSVGALVWWLGQRRRQGLERLAEELGLEPLEGGAVPLPPDAVLEPRAGRGWQVRSEVGALLKGRRGGLDLYAFEYRYFTVDARGQRRTWANPVAALLLVAPGLDLPAFLIRPEGLADRVRTALGGQDLDFPDSPTFSRRYLVRCQDEAALRRLLGPEARAFLERCPGRVVQGFANTLLYYRPAAWLAPEPFRAPVVRALVQEGLELLTRLGWHPSETPAPEAPRPRRRRSPGSPRKARK